MEQIPKLLELLPAFEEIEEIVKAEPEAAYMLRLALENLGHIQHVNNLEDNEVHFLIQALSDKCWERIHTGHFSKVALEIRKIYALANFLLIIYLLFESSSQQQMERCIKLFDESLLIGCTQALFPNSECFQQELTQLLNSGLDAAQLNLPTLAPLDRQKHRCDIKQIDCPSVESFLQTCLEPQLPALLLNTIDHWPALEKWRNLNYILDTAGNRLVPIEIGSNYATEEWSQQLVKIRDFLRRQFGGQNDDSNNDIEYLAQHELFDQIPALKRDIIIPDYCTYNSSSTTVEIKAWLGPKGTISPLHYDPKHNLLCQVFGAKRIILAAPEDTPHIYAHETEFLSNTSKVDAENLELEKYPLTSLVKFYELTLQEGDCLYIPPKWWHYVRSLSESFSVSFWWNPDRKI